MPESADVFFSAYPMVLNALPLNTGSKIILCRHHIYGQYGTKAQKTVERVMRKMKKGKLKSGGSGKIVKSRKQAIAIALSEARKSGAKVPKVPKKKTTAAGAVRRTSA